jgi:hypothetical protein
MIVLVVWRRPNVKVAKISSFRVLMALAVSAQKDSEKL